DDVLGEDAEGDAVLGHGPRQGEEAVRVVAHGADGAVDAAEAQADEPHGWFLTAPAPVPGRPRQGAALPAHIPHPRARWATATRGPSPAPGAAPAARRSGCARSRAARRARGWARPARARARAAAGAPGRRPARPRPRASGGRGRGSGGPAGA